MQAARALCGLLLLQTGWEPSCIQALRVAVQVLYRVT